MKTNLQLCRMGVAITTLVYSIFQISRFPLKYNNYLLINFLDKPIIDASQAINKFQYFEDLLNLLTITG